MSDSSTVAVVPAPNIVPIVHGPMLVGVILNILLYGISITQTFFYASRYKNDQWYLKALVLFLFVADTMNSVFDVIYTYDSLINHYNDPAAIAKANWVFATDPAMVSLVAAAVQGFFTFRVKVLTGSVWLMIILTVGTIISGLGGVATSIAIGIVPDWLEFQKFKIPVIVWLVTSALVDTTITVVLTWKLRKHKTGFQHTDNVLDRIIRLTVQTGLITSVWAITDLIVFLVTPTGLHLAFNFPLSKLYSNSLLSSLNARGNFVQGSRHTEDWHEPKITHSSGGGMVSFHPDATRPEVFVNVESHELVDRPAEKVLSLDNHPGFLDIKRGGFGDGDHAV